MSMKYSYLAAAMVALSMSGHAAAQDVTAGEKVFKKCRSCHKVGDDAKNAVGPMLNNVVGRQAGTVEGYKYGKDLVAAGEKGLVWTAENIDPYLADPKKFLREFLENPKAKSKMSFKLKKEQQRADVIAYVASFSPEAATEETEAASEGGTDN